MPNTWFYDLLQGLVADEEVTAIVLDIYNIETGVTAIKEEHPVRNLEERKAVLLQVVLQCQILRYLPESAPRYAVSITFARSQSATVDDQAVWINPPRI